ALVPDNASQHPLSEPVFSRLRFDLQRSLAYTGPMIAPERRTNTQIAKQPDRTLVPRAALGQVVDPLDLGEAVRAFLRTLEGRNASPETIRAYTTSLGQFRAYLAESYPAGLRGTGRAT